MTIQEIYSRYINTLSGSYGENEARSISSIVLCVVFETNSSYWRARMTDSLSKDYENKLIEILQQLESGRPVQYVLGEVDFCGLRLHVDESVLIPRPETEELVYWIVEDSKNMQELTILDACTGSACIAIALSKLLKASSISALDISKEALSVAAKNIALNSTSVNLLEIDILNPSKGESIKEMDILVSNPPYIRPSESALMRKNVLDYEPAVALFAPEEDPLIFYRVLSEIAVEKLKPQGAVYLEINEALAKEVVAIFLQKGFIDAKLRKDLNQKDRMLRFKR